MLLLSVEHCRCFTNLHFFFINTYNFNESDHEKYDFLLYFLVVLRILEDFPTSPFLHLSLSMLSFIVFLRMYLFFNIFDSVFSTQSKGLFPFKYFYIVFIKIPLDFQKWSSPLKSIDRGV